MWTDEQSRLDDMIIFTYLVSNQTVHQHYSSVLELSPRCL